MSRLKNSCYLITVSEPARLATASAEVAFVGRSNVGKSSLLNSVCGKKKLAHTSQVPGKTRTVNVFAAAAGRWLVDLPGYGFAVGPAAERERWQEMIEGYLLGRPSLRMVYLLIDAKVGATKLDMQMTLWLQSKEIPFRIVANKSDKVAKPKLQERRQEISVALGYSPEHIFLVSAQKGAGIAELERSIADALEL
jgi:GTP-binding protein